MGTETRDAAIKLADQTVLIHKKISIFVDIKQVSSNNMKRCF